MKVSAELLKRLLAEKHKEDVYVPECKNGPTHTNDGLRILDAWVMKKSWVNPLTIGYEVKVSRSDFVRDDKWGEYLPLCHEFYFVCPSGLIGVDELPPQVGLLWASKNGTKLLTKRKAVRRTPDSAKLAELVNYVLMCRVTIGFGTLETKEDRVAAVEHYLAQAERRQRLAQCVNEHVKKRFSELKSKQTELERGVREAQAVVDYLNSLGIKWQDGDTSWIARREIDKLRGALPSDFGYALRRAIDGLQSVQSALEVE